MLLQTVGNLWLGAGSAGPRSFFMNNEPGVYLDFSRTQGLYQDNLAATPLVAPDQWMKLAADVSRTRSPITIAAALQANTGLSPKWGRAPKVKRNLLTLGGAALLTNTDGVSLIDNAPTGFTPPVDAAFQRITKNSAVTTFYAYRASQPGSTTDPSVFSWYMLPDAGCTQIGMQTSASAQGQFRYNLSTGVTVKGVNTADAGAIPIGGGWYRCWTKAMAVTASLTWSIVAVTAAAGDAASFVVGGHQSEANALTALQKTLSAFDMTEAGVPSYGFARFGLDDDILSATLPAAQTGDVLVFGRKGSWIETGVTYGSGSTWSIGVTTVTGLPAGLLAAIGDIVGIIAIGRTLTATERNMALAYHKARGAAGWLVAGAELVTNGDFSGGTTGWTDITGSWSVSGGALVGTGIGPLAYGPYSNGTGVVSGQFYLAVFGLTVTAGNLLIRVGNTETSAYATSGTFSRIIQATSTGVTVFQPRAGGAGFTGSIDNVSVKPLTVAA